MLRFNSLLAGKTIGLTIFQYILCYGSTIELNNSVNSNLLFQYILCYGSTLNRQLGWLGLCHFNTSYVTVQQKYYLGKTGKITISIHPMLRFNK